MVLAFIVIWFLREAKAVLFWLYLWQLKEYHIGRFVAHFQTAKGRRLLLNPLLGVKLVLLSIVFIVPEAIFLAIPLYAVELFRKIPRPVFTRKAQFLIVAFACFLFAFALLDSLVLLLLFDIATPLFVSAVVLGFQPFAVMARNRILAKAKAKRKRCKNLKVIGITGSYGKTSTKEFLAHILGQKFRVLKTPEHVNSEVGVAQTILRSLTNEHEVFVCEMGAYNKGGIKLLADIAQPDIGIVTGVNEQHLATFGSMENLLSAEGGGELAAALPEEGALFVNQNSRLLRQKGGFGGQAKVKNYSEAENVIVEKDHISFAVEGVNFTVPVYGGHNVENLTLAIAAAQEFGMTLREIAKAAATMPLELSAMKVKKAASGATIIDSTYSANPDGVIADLEYLSLYEGKKVLVMPCLIELGPAAKDAHRRIGQKIAEVCDLTIITTKEHFTDIQEGAGNSGKVVFMEKAHDIMQKIEGAEAILLEGGKESRLQLQLLALLQQHD